MHAASFFWSVAPACDQRAFEFVGPKVGLAALADHANYAVAVIQYIGSHGHCFAVTAQGFYQNCVADYRIELDLDCRSGIWSNALLAIADFRLFADTFRVDDNGVVAVWR